MKRLLYAVALLLPLLCGAYRASAQEQTTQEEMGYASEWKYAFSKEGRQEWRPEFTLRYMTGFCATAPIITGGVKIDNKRTFSLLVGRGDTYVDYAPGDIYTIMTGIAFRRYFHLGKRKIFAIYSDLYIGAGWVDKVDGKYATGPLGERKEQIEESAGDVILIGGWQPGIRVRFFNNLHLFLGPTIAHDCIGVHFGVGF